MATVSESVAKWTPPTNNPDAVYEYVDGEWKETTRMGVLAGMVASVLVHKLNDFGLQQRRGIALGEVLFRLAPDGPARRPDVAYVSFDRWPPSLPLDEDPPVCEVVPNLAVEVVSPTNTADEIVDKLRDYFFNGIPLVWVIYPRQRYVYVYESPLDVQGVSEKDVLDGGTAIPGFKLPVADLFSALPRATKGSIDGTDP